MTRAIKLGISLPTYAPLGSPEAIVRVAEGAERIGLASVWTFERLLRPVAPVSPGHGIPPTTLPDFYASVTTRWKPSPTSRPGPAGSVSVPACSTPCSTRRSCWLVASPLSTNSAAAGSTSASGRA